MWSSRTVFNIIIEYDNNRNVSWAQIGILDWFVKDHVKTAVMLPNIQLRITGINYILQYIQTESSYLNCNNI